MCQQCNYLDLLRQAGLQATAHRKHILEVVGNHSAPMSAQEIFNTVQRSKPINRVTVYRVLDLLVQHGLVERLSGGGRAFFYGLAPNSLHDPHPHFYCKSCGQMDCLRPESITINLGALRRIFTGQIEKVAVRVDGVCKKCLRVASAVESGPPDSGLSRRSHCR